ncbi:MAG: SprT family zinc-dependent metalloprotease [Patescibacteria group bacterium]|jgi:hypothetical protein
MKKLIELQQKKIEYTLKVSQRARHLRLAIYGDGNFVVTAPHHLSENFIEQFIFQKSQWIIEKLEHFKKFTGNVEPKNVKKDYAEYRFQALMLARSRIAHYKEIYGFKTRRITIKNQKTCWGSCSKKGNLNFNYKIAKLPEKLADYVIVHELCHLKELNHSKKFWRLVEQIIPDYLELRKSLKKDSEILSA